MKVNQLSPDPDLLGESPFWSIKEQSLYWVDMLRRVIQRLDWATGRMENSPTPDFPTAFALRRGGGTIVALNRGVHLYDFRGPFTPLCVPEPGLEDQRLNEGRCAPDGASGSAQCGPTSRPMVR